MTNPDADFHDPGRLAEWVAQAEAHPTQRSIVLGSRCTSKLQSIGATVARYLNEFDTQGEGRWRAFNHQDLQHLAGNPSTCRIILGDTPPGLPEGPTDSDLDRVTRRLALLGGVILEGQEGLDATNDLSSSFRACLCRSHPACLEPCHIWLNPGAFSDRSLVAVIADSFLDWSSRRPGFLDAETARNAQSPTSRAEPGSRHCASL